MLFALLYGGGYLAQFMRNYTEWKNAGNFPGNGTSPSMPSFDIAACFQAVLSFPYGIFGTLIFVQDGLAYNGICACRPGYGGGGRVCCRECW